jgi:uncharacterized protein YcbK (DUF882 family)
MQRTLQFVLLISGLVFMSGSFGNISDARTLKFYHTHTGDSLQVTYFANGRYDPGALQDLKVFLADWRDEQQKDIDPQLLDILWQIQRQTGNHDTFEVISAYRSPQTNEMLRTTTSGVAKTSQHLIGKAIDVRLRGLDTAMLRDTALKLHKGGVGYYAQSDFVHIDTGRPRFW